MIGFRSMSRLHTHLSVLLRSYSKLKYLIANPKIMYRSSMTYFCIPIFVLVLTVGIIFLNFSIKTTFFGFDDNAFVTTVYAQSDLSSLSPEEIREQSKDFLSTLMELRNQSTTNDSSEDESIDNSSAGGTDLVTQQFATDVSGSYSNPSYGILDFVIPSGLVWF
jgi:hypothetical protein